ncbi:YqcC family protein [Vibrio sp.]|nr:YqcC family protein [Vibrio sp.]
MTSQYSTHIRDLLHNLRDELIAIGLWEQSPPDKEKLLSTTPFAMDTLAPHQWLQWIFIPKMFEAIDNRSVPKGFAVAPYFSECWKDNRDMSAVLVVLEEIDGASSSC